MIPFTQSDIQKLVKTLVNEINELYLQNPYEVIKLAKKAGVKKPTFLVTPPNEVIKLAKKAGVKKPTFLVTPPTKPTFNELDFAKLKNIAEITTQISHKLPIVLRNYFEQFTKEPKVLNDIVETYYKLAKIIPKEVVNKEPIVITQEDNFVSKSVPPVLKLG